MADPRFQQKLAAILVADVAGYSRLMEADEQATVTCLDACRMVFREHVARGGGRIVDTAGDSVLAIFPSAIGAVDAAIEIQGEIHRRNEEWPEDQRMQFRIGVNLGDVIEKDDGTIYGSGVNVAARLQGLAEPGSFMISEDVHRQLSGKLKQIFEPAGSHQVKNIGAPVSAFRLAGETAPSVPASGDGGASVDSKPSVAVLPFDNLSGDPEQEYFADGIAEEIITELSRFRDLKVLARNSTFQFKGHSVDIRHIGNELGARFVLEGSVRRAGDRIRVTAQLIDVTDGSHLWAETYQRNLTASDIFDIQDDVADRVVATIADSFGVLSRFQLAQRRYRKADSIDSFEAVLRAKAYYRENFGSEAHKQIKEDLERAVEADPDYADAWAWLAAAYRDEYNLRFNSAVTSLAKAETTARKAIALDPENQEAHLVLTQVHILNRDIDAFREAAARTVALNPNSPDKLGAISIYTFYSGDWTEGVALAEKAIALSPNPPGYFFVPLALDRYRRGQFAEALGEARKIDLSYFDRAQVILAAIYGQLGRKDDADAARRKLLELNDQFAIDARAELRKIFYSDELVMCILDGLRKAGLDFPDEPAANL